MEEVNIKRVKGTVGARLLVVFLSVTLGFLVLWLLGFINSDIRRIPGPTHDAVEKQFPELVNLDKEIRELTEKIRINSKEIELKKERLQLLSSQSTGIQTSLSSLLNLKRSESLTEAEKEKISEYITGFLKAQDELSALHAEIQKLGVAGESDQLQLTKLTFARDQIKPKVEGKFNSERSKFKILLGIYQLLAMLPFVLIAGFLMLKKRGSSFYPIYLAFGIAVLVQVIEVAHTYFPSRYTKYVLLLSVLIVVLMLLIHIIKQIAKPKKQMLQKQYRQAYEKYVCPFCEYPIQVGPFKFAIRNKKGKVISSPQTPQNSGDLEPYVCPSCGEKLFGKCEHCGEIRHSLLDYCEHCGNSFANK